MDKQKATKIAGISAVAVVVSGFAVFGLSQTKGSPLYGFFNNSANEKKVSSVEDRSESKEEKIDDRLSANSEEAKRDAENSKFPMNRINTWSADDILKTPKNTDYKYNEDDPARKLPNDEGVGKPSDYKRLVQSYSAVYQNRKYRNAKDDTYEAARNEFSSVLTILQDYQRKVMASTATAGADDEYTKIVIEHFNSDDKYLKELVTIIQADNANLEIDPDTFRLKMTSNEDGGVYAFETIVRDKESKEQFAYVSGFYNSKLNYFNVTSSFMLLDGAVAFDKYTFTIKPTQEQ